MDGQRNLHDGRLDRGRPVNTTYQVADDHTPAPGTQALITAQNPGGGIGTDDVDGGSCTVTSVAYPVTGAGSLEIWYSFAQRDAGDDAAADGFLLEASFDGGGAWTPLVSFGDIARGKGWDVVNAAVPGTATSVVIRATATDGPSAGDIVEAALDDFTLSTRHAGRHLLGGRGRHQRRKHRQHRDR